LAGLNVGVAQSVESIDEQATHTHTRELTVPGRDGDTKMQVNAFCLSPKGEILAACGDGPGEVRVLSADGKFLRSWKVDFKPEAINTAGDGTVLVGGLGELVRYSAEGKELVRGQSPHISVLKKNTKELREQAIARINMMRGQYRRPAPRDMIARYQNILAQLEKKGQESELSKAELRVIESIEQRIALLEKEVAESEEEDEADEEEEKAPEVSEKQIAEMMESMTNRKKRIASISTDDKNVYIATPALTGYGYAVWKVADDFTAGEVIVSELRGCCGQMDVQCCENGIYVAENSRHRVARFDTLGKEVGTWGGKDRTGIDGFTSCCNPMNVTFGANGDVYTAESSTGRIKRFSADGKFLSYVGDVKLVPGCKNVSIAVAPEADRIYMLDITRNHIVVMKRKTDDSTENSGESKS